VGQFDVAAALCRHVVRHLADKLAATTAKLTHYRMPRAFHIKATLAIAHALASSTSAISLAVRPYRSYTSRSASSPHHVVKGQLGVPHNLVEESFPQIAFAVDGDSRPAPVGMNEHGMASRLAVQGKAAPL
jgi:hypothetical protein